MDKEYILDLLENYQTMLSTSGYVKPGLTSKLVILTFIEELINSSLSLYLTDNDLNSIQEYLYTILGNECLKMPVNSLPKNDRVIIADNVGLRLTQFNKPMASNNLTRIN